MTNGIGPLGSVTDLIRAAQEEESRRRMTHPPPLPDYGEIFRQNFLLGLIADLPDFFTQAAHGPWAPLSPSPLSLTPVQDYMRAQGVLTEKATPTDEPGEAIALVSCLGGGLIGGVHPDVVARVGPRVAREVVGGAGTTRAPWIAQRGGPPKEPKIWVREEGGELVPVRVPPPTPPGGALEVAKLDLWPEKKAAPEPGPRTAAEEERLERMERLMAADEANRGLYRQIHRQLQAERGPETEPLTAEYLARQREETIQVLEALKAARRYLDQPPEVAPPPFASASIRDPISGARRPLELRREADDYRWYESGERTNIRGKTIAEARNEARWAWPGNWEPHFDEPAGATAPSAPKWFEDAAGKRWELDEPVAAPYQGQIPDEFKAMLARRRARGQTIDIAPAQRGEAAPSYQEQIAALNQRLEAASKRMNQTRATPEWGAARDEFQRVFAERQALVEAERTRRAAAPGLLPYPPPGVSWYW
jgi:hypothetical protein